MFLAKQHFSHAGIVKSDLGTPSRWTELKADAAQTRAFQAPSPAFRWIHPQGATG